MASRYIHKTVVMAKLETTYGVFVAPAPATDALLISDVTIDYQDSPVDRALIRPFLGASEQLVGTRSVVISFSVEIAGSGTAGTAPAYGKLLRACAMAETVTAGKNVIYNPISTGMESMSIMYAVDGVKHAIRGARGTVDLSMTANSRPLLKFKFVGVENTWEANMPTGVVLTQWKPPLPVSDTNSGDIMVGGTWQDTWVSGGTAWPSQGIELSLGTDPKFVSMLGSSEVAITSREVTGTAKFALDSADEVQLISDAKTLTTRAVSFRHGTVAGNVVVVHMPAVQFVSPKYESIEGKVGVSVNLRVCPLDGNDEILIVVR